MSHFLLAQFFSKNLPYLAGNLPYSAGCIHVFAVANLLWYLHSQSQMAEVLVSLVPEYPSHHGSQ